MFGGKADLPSPSSMFGTKNFQSTEPDQRQRSYKGKDYQMMQEKNKNKLKLMKITKRISK